MDIVEKKIYFQEDFLRYRNCEFNKNKAINFFQKFYMVVSNPGLFSILNHRYGIWISLKYSKSESDFLRNVLSLIYNLGKKLSIIWGNIVIQDLVPIGSGFYISNKGGVIIGAERIGKNCTVYSTVTIGIDRNTKKPVIGNSVTILDNCVVYGGINIGDYSIIMQDSVLSKSLPIGATAKGNPAKIIKNDV